MKDYVEKQKIDLHSAGMLTTREIPEDGVYDLNMEEIMEIFADLFTPTRIVDENSFNNLNGPDLNNSQKKSHKFENSPDFNSVVSPKDQNYISNYLSKEKKVYYSLLIRKMKNWKLVKNFMINLNPY